MQAVRDFLYILQHGFREAMLRAITSINTLTYSDQFTGNLVPWNVSLGSIEIAANYFKNEPRRVTVMLPPSPGYHEGFVLKSRRPHWNPEHAVYELDFGGRINRDSVKNFQLDHNGEVVSVIGIIGCPKEERIYSHILWFLFLLPACSSVVGAPVHSVRWI